MDPRRRRKLTELARVHEQWQARYGIDDAEFVPAGADGAHRRSPTPEQEHELMRSMGEVLGFDPATGHYRAGLEDPPLARTGREAHLYMDRRPCPCGEVHFDRSETVVALPDGGRASRHAAACPHCGQARLFVFRLPPDPLPDAVDPRYGGDQPSELLDPGEWLLVADEYASAMTPDPDQLSEAERRQTRTRLRAAAAAIDEVLKFVPSGHATVPPTAFWSERGDSLYTDDPDRFEVARLHAERDAYRHALARLDG